MDEKTPLCPHGLLPCGKGCETCTAECEKDRTAFAQELLGPLASPTSLHARMTMLCLGDEDVMRLGRKFRELHDRWAEANTERNKAEGKLAPTQRKLRETEAELDDRLHEVGCLAQANADIGMYNLVLREKLDALANEPVKCAWCLRVIADRRDGDANNQHLAAEHMKTCDKHPLRIYEAQATAWLSLLPSEYVPALKRADGSDDVEAMLTRGLDELVRRERKLEAQLAVERNSNTLLESKLKTATEKLDKERLETLTAAMTGSGAPLVVGVEMASEPLVVGTEPDADVALALAHERADGVFKVVQVYRGEAAREAIQHARRSMASAHPIAQAAMAKLDDAIAKIDAAGAMPGATGERDWTGAANAMLASAKPPSKSDLVEPLIVAVPPGSAACTCDAEHPEKYCGVHPPF